MIVYGSENERDSNNNEAMRGEAGISAQKKGPTMMVGPEAGTTVKSIELPCREGEGICSIIVSCRVFNSTCRDRDRIGRFPLQ